MPPSLTTGEIIQIRRERKGLSRPVLADLVGGYSSDWLKRIEAGQRGISLPNLVKIALLLDITDLADLIDGDVPMPVSEWSAPPHPAALAVRDILGATPFTPARHDQPPPDITVLARKTAGLWRAWHTAIDNRTTVAADLPTLIRELDQATITLDGTPRRRAHAAQASAYCLAQHLAVDITDAETGRVLADRAARSAQAADDPVSLALCAWTYGHVLRGTDPDAALGIVAAAARQLRGHLGDDSDALGLLGSLELHCAVSAAHQGMAGVAWRFWDAAAEVSANLPVRYSHPQTAFGASNVAIHGVSIAADLRQHGHAVHRASDIKANHISSRERRARLFGETAAGHLEQRDQQGALHYLRRAYATAPETAPYSPLTRGVAVDLVRSTAGPLKKSAVALAEQMGILPAAD